MRTTDRTNLQLLAIIRCILVSGQTIALAIAHYYLQLELNYTVLICALLLLLFLAIYILRKPGEASSREYFAQIVADIVILTIILYYTGGSTNPFVSYYLVPLTISAAILPWSYTWTIAGMSLTLYTLLLFVYRPLDIFTSSTMHEDSVMNPHIIGMWINFVISALLITYFVVKMARQLRDRDEELHRANEDRLRDEQIMSLATMAAGTAHELGTPLSTVSVLLSEMRSEKESSDQDCNDIDLMLEQIDRCKETLRDLVDSADKNSSGRGTPEVSDAYISGILDKWRVIRPATSVFLSSSGDGTAPDVFTDSTLTQAIMNLLNNAADASPAEIAVETRWTSSNVTLNIRDSGPGIDPRIIDELGKPFTTTKSSGLGVGLFLAEATIRRLGGELRFENHAQGGAVATMKLPAVSTDV